MLTGKIRGQVDQIWNNFWTGGISNPLTVIEQISYLLFLKRLDDLHKNALERIRYGKDAQTIFPPDKEHLRWSSFKELEPELMFKLVKDEAFPFITELHGDRDTAYTRNMQGATFMIGKPSLLAAVVDLIDKIPMDDGDTKGDLYEYLLSKLSTAGTNGQFRTPRHIIQMMVALANPSLGGNVCDPACGTSGFLMATARWLRDMHPEEFYDADWRKVFNTEYFHGYDFDPSMLRIGAMNMMLHGIEDPHLERQDTLGKAFGDKDSLYHLILANPPFKGSLDYEDTAPNLQVGTSKTKKTELLFLSLFLRLLKKGGLCAVIVPDGVLFGSSKAHQEIRKTLVEKHQLEAVISMPSGVFRPYAGVSTGILLFRKTDREGDTKDVWFYV